MSLLMDALKKAEQAKQGSQAEAGAAADLRLEPIDSAAATESVPEGRSLPELPVQLEVLDAEFAAHPRTPPAARGATPPPPPERSTAARHAPSPREPATASAAVAAAERSAAQQLFTAKQPPATRKTFVIGASIAGLLGMAGIAGYVWWQMQPKSGLANPMLARLAPPPAPIARTPAPPPAPAPAATAAAATPAASPATPAMAAAGRDEDDEATPAPPARRRQAAATPVVPAAAPSDSPIRITKSQFQVNPAVASGFAALAGGDLAAAATEYERVLRGEPKNRDALHGMASIALRQGDAAAASQWYLKALDADPKDAVAGAGLIGLKGQGDPLAAESRLKSLIAERPDLAVLHFALGNVHARQGRWNDAQQAYFKAYSAEPEQPDYLYNLAVSLDHLRQSGLAAQYYQQALDAAAHRPAAFDKAQIASRLRELKP